MSRTLALFLVVLAFAIACSSNATPTPIGDGAIDTTVVEHLLTSDDIKSVGGDPSGLEQRTEDLSDVISMVNPSELESVDAWFSRSLTSASKPGIVMALRRFNDAALAIGQLESIETGGAFQSMDAPVGDRSAFAQGGDGGGYSIAFISGRTLVVLQCPSAPDSTTLLDAGQLRSLAELIEARL